MDEIERILFDSGDWIPAKSLAWQGRMDERDLRQSGENEGAASKFAISGQLGLKHVAKATKEEWLAFKHSMMRHAIAEIRRVKKLEQRRRAVLYEWMWEADSGQGVMF